MKNIFREKYFSKSIYFLCGCSTMICNCYNEAELSLDAGMRTRYRPGAGTKDFKISPVPVPVDFSIQYQIKNFYT